MIVFLFGLPGVGKTYIGQLIEKKLAAIYWDGDNALTEEMREAVRNEQPFSEAMTAQLSFSMINKIKQLSTEHDFVVVSQAMLLETDRQKFLETFNDIQFIYVTCHPDEITQRVANRADFVTVPFCQKLFIAFEPHRAIAESYPTLENFNKSDEQLIADFTTLLPASNTIWKPKFFFNQAKQEHKFRENETTAELR